jgi:uncharacterized RDD family membrane protein YckC
MTARVDPIPQEARVFQGRRAGLVTRAAAAGIDVGVVVVALIVAYLGVIVVVFVMPPGGFEIPVPPPWLGVAAPLVLMLYLTVWWDRGGRTYGCHVMGLRVVDRQGQDPGLGRALLRAALYVVFPLGLAWVVFSRQNRSIQDLVLGTSVIYDWDMRPRVRAASPS